MQENLKNKLEVVKELNQKRWNDSDDWQILNEQMKQILYEILQSNTESTEALINLGAIYSDCGEYETSLNYLLKAKKLKSEDKNLFLNLGYVSIYLQKSKNEYLKYFELAKNKVKNELTFEAYFDPNSH